MKLPAMIPVSSRNVASIGFDGADLFVSFRSGAIYQYEKVAQAVYAKGLAAPSANDWLRADVKGRYPHRKIQDAKPLDR